MSGMSLMNQHKFGMCYCTWKSLLVAKQMRLMCVFLQSRTSLHQAPIDLGGMSFVAAVSMKSPSGRCEIET